MSKDVKTPSPVKPMTAPMPKDEPKSQGNPKPTESFYRLRRLDTWTYVVEKVALDRASGSFLVTEVTKPDLKQITLAKLEALLCV